jgi:ribosomal protein S15P/S13E
MVASLDSKDELEAIIKSLAKKTVDNALKSEDVLRLTQSALNLANTISVLSNIDKP